MSYRDERDGGRWLGAPGLAFETWEPKLTNSPWEPQALFVAYQPHCPER
jgi:hypothetical protein